ncbi:MAG: flagellar basal body rod protein FlgC [Candidatus Lambdaproteobacteria bacterium RIFOXYD1_FULL_56_27]|uniref:Flagellar basal-body rod protein FlgC n=1 Tax=Candidatus Lambdaproteobacteria bacterium RIFOXYD2_FULL_56_26 TaxID=1817773 RepID=A0A1F6H2N1_9PROT|nr:MAG: flagellar basal body rod protein FlgC [Candidatus Lambdaproteobacteria bacterium RIFOXYC1_FULL_56_13]OGH04651.1 MAG: flagellar basal body rod protein FlgC [Candidatus Lambdaproteobacteria bacterium RIFOXYD2_FULL_56_26]OGH09115.1 MAG: flagellar basal body rod protein FlgC [Candidatus Lambdaproteobacteria bacterium RIFOXYD1_FULL_56_27]
MSLFDAMEISSSGLSAQRTRMKVISSNIANVNTTRTPGGGPYRRKEVIFGALPQAKSFMEELRTQEKDQGAREVKVLGVVEDSRPPKMKYDPSHPDANEEGYVALPNVDIVEEMTNLMVSKRSYEANLAAINATKNLIAKSLEIGGRA